MIVMAVLRFFSFYLSSCMQCMQSDTLIELKNYEASLNTIEKVHAMQFIKKFRGYNDKSLYRYKYDEKRFCAKMAAVSLFNNNM